jgi:hypothetical protein
MPILLTTPPPAAVEAHATVETRDAMGDRALADVAAFLHGATPPDPLAAPGR